MSDGINGPTFWAFLGHRVDALSTIFHIMRMITVIWFYVQKY